MDPAARIAHLTGAAVGELRVIGGQHLWRHYRGLLADGRVIFAKISERDLGELLRSEASGLRWLAGAGAVPVPDVLGADHNAIVLSWVPEESAGTAAAEQFGRDLARLHASGADAFGAPWQGFIASLPLDNEQASGPDAWPGWYAERRVHGDCWWGNVLWSGGRGWLIDPAAHGGHRETDLAFMALFSPPHLDRILAAYAETTPLADGWRDRVPLHQLHPLLVHACLFGAQYAPSVRAAAQAALRS